ncbi:FAD-binding oxidoreductase [Nonomuraea sp. NBC_01738]|uniref:FAD-binding oxidoreductase n=1 Tax=Nonomuraea sp. NBC_01738 TaxID=2976003 RepID=UPI002E14B5B1|nr:FAD-binding oxidoreductase [Nonomuraea sp. NBC_01738]
MPIDPALVRASFARVEPHAERAAAYFYGRLFAENAQLRALFPPVMDMRRDRLFAALGQILARVDDLGGLGDFLGQLGRDHRKFGLLPEHYTAVGRALIATVRRFCGPAWDNVTEAAWISAYTAAANLMIEAAAADTQPAWWPAEVVAHERRTPDIAVITLRPSGRLPYRAGQYVSVQTPRRPRVWRSYSVANAPRADGCLQLHVRAVPGGTVSPALVKETAPGDGVLLGPAVGTMAAPEGDRELLLVAGGTGLAPLKAILQQVLASGRRPGTHLLVGARTARELYDLPDLLVLASRHPRLRLFPVISAEAGADGLRGRVPDVLERFHPWTAHEAYVCGPSGMVEAAVARLREDGVPAHRIHHDLRGERAALPSPAVW